MDVASFLNEELKQIDAKIASAKVNDQIPLTFTFPEMNLVTLSRSAATEKIWFFESKENQLQVLGLGVAQSLSISGAREFLKKTSYHFLFAQCDFEATGEQLSITLPEWTFINKNGKTTLIIRPSQDFCSYSPSNLLFNTEFWESFQSTWTTYEERPEHDEWNLMIKEAHQLFEDQKLKKIVLSRTKIYQYDELIDQLKLFQDVYIDNRSSSHFTLFHQSSPQSGFLSLTPEKLFTIKNNQVETLSLAGSMPRGESEEADGIQENQLITSEKLILEQQTVTAEICERLNEACDNIIVSPLKIMKLPYIFHRQIDITATLKPQQDAFDLISMLHPTPAVGGQPRVAAALHIRQLEKAPRGQYAGPFGIISKEFSEIAVAIRAIKMEDTTLTIYGGAGIVEGSVAEEEWHETGIKMKPFLKVINQSWH